MPIYAVTFRLDDRTYNGHTYNDRYNSLVEAIQSLDLRADSYWEEPTSFFLFRFLRPPQFVKKHIEENAILDPDRDLVFGFVVRGGTSFVIGQPNDSDTLENLRKAMHPPTT